MNYITITLSIDANRIEAVTIPNLLEALITDIQSNPNRIPTVHELHFAGQLHALRQQYIEDEESRLLVRQAVFHGDELKLAAELRELFDHETQKRRSQQPTA